MNRAAMPLVAVDDGFADIKAAWFVENQMHTLSHPAIARRGVDINDMQGGPVGAYETDGDSFTVYRHAAGAEPTRTENYSTSSLNRVLVHHVLRTAGFGGQPIAVATGLPVRDFYINGRPNVSLIQAKSKSITTAIASLSGEPMPQIAASYVYPQAMMAWIDYVTADDGELNESLAQQVVAVVDVGGRTTDFAVLLPGADGRPLVDHKRSGSIDLGVLNIHDVLLPKLLNEFKAREMPTSKLDEAVRTRSMRAFGKQHDVAAHVEAASRDVASRLLSETEKRLGSAVDIDTVLFVGGGAEVLSGALKSYPHITVPSTPEFANARGLLKYLTYCEPSLSSDSSVVPMKARA